MAFVNPQISDFKSYFFRDFPFGTDLENNVLDVDIANAFQLVNASINPSFFADQSTYSVGYNLLGAHYLVTNLRASSQGINGQYNWLQNSKSVGAVSESFSIPERILANPYLSSLSKTNYGQSYLMMILPQLTGFMYGVYGPPKAE